MESVPRAFSSPDWISSAPSAFLHKKDVPAPQSSSSVSSSSSTFFLYGSRTPCSRWGFMRAEQVEIITFLALLATPVLLQPLVQLAFWATCAHCRLMFCFSSTGILKSFSARVLPVSYSTSLHTYLGLPWHRCSTLHLALLNLIWFIWAYILSLSISLCVASLPSIVLSVSVILAAWCHLQTSWGYTRTSWLCAW